ncbi:uncharacterized protein LOC135084777 [Ostrinia nubilalis]|uniref:uncharacterized protein LOC135084777 n=1 Tax=Ostrinia nubilalis TaxID=29057 RepID=UPI0030822818
MEIDNKRHGKKSDKETQSPVLKVFKEMIQRENNDPEKANLLKEKQENRKRRQYSGSRSKTNRVNRSCDSSSSEKNKRSVQYKVAHEQRLKDFNERSQSIPYRCFWTKIWASVEKKQRMILSHYCLTESRGLNRLCGLVVRPPASDAEPFQGDKKDSWWFWGDNQNKRSEDTCSCVSCALKKIVSSEYTCIACLGILFLISVLVAFMVLFRTVPMVAKTGHPNLMPGKKPREGSDVLKRKIDLIQRGCKDDERRLWDDTLTRHLSSLTGMNGNDFDDGNYRETL